jgi:alpha-1,2-mannosyltransferase
VIGLFALTSVAIKPACLRNPKLYLSAVLALVLTVLPSFLADWWFYGSPTLAVFNVLLYNTSFGSNLVGASVLYGVEPWTFYIKNLLLNFNIAFPLALLSPGLLLVKATPQRPLLACIAAGFFGWLLLMTSQPHKEERFMYVIYPSLCILAAWVLCVCKPVLKWTLLIAFCVISVLRSAQQTRSFFAPLAVWNSPITGRVCVGKEWYRFPSSFFLDGAEIAFYEDGFTGQLPQPFTSTTSVPSNFNSFNLEEVSRYVPIESCDYVVDVNLPSSPMRSELSSWVKSM